MTPSDSTEPKIFGIGLSKTGTSSLDCALNDLRIRSIHFPSDHTTYTELSEGRYRLTILESFQAATDISVAPFYAQLDQVYPNSKFVLTVRDLDAWLDSVCDHWEFMWQWAPHDRQFRKFLEFITACVYGVHKYHRDRFVYAYRQHLKSVREYFADRPGDLLTLDICAGDGWEQLCPFLNVPVPAQPFPYANRREEKLDRVGWINTLEQAVRDFQAIVPADERYILIDEERLAGSGLEDPVRARRPMEQDGLYWGPPADAASAIAAIEKLRRDGVNYLVLAWTAFWWLEHYSDFKLFLRDQFQPLLDNERLLVMDLRTAKRA